MDKNEMGLTGKQARVAELIPQGVTNKEIAFQLGLSEKTIKAHCTSIYKALGVRNRTEASRVLTSDPIFGKHTPEKVIERVFRSVYPVASIKACYVTETEQWHVIVDRDRKSVV